MSNDNEENVVELGVHEPSIGSILSRLTRHQDDIEDMTVVIKWKDAGYSVASPTKKVNDMALEIAILQDELFNVLNQ